MVKWSWVEIKCQWCSHSLSIFKDYFVCTVCVCVRERVCVCVCVCLYADLFSLMHLADCSFLSIHFKPINQNLIDLIRKCMMWKKMVVCVCVCFYMCVLMHLNSELLLIYIPISCALLILIKAKEPTLHFFIWSYTLSHSHSLTHMHTHAHTHTQAKLLPLASTRFTCTNLVFTTGY